MSKKNPHYKKLYIQQSDILNREDFLKQISEKVLQIYNDGGYKIASNKDIETFQDALWKEDINLTWTEIRKIIGT